MIFLSITGGFASTVIYDKYQTRRAREKWCNLVSHIADEHLDNHRMPRKMTVYLAAPPGDGLRAAREHFHVYVKPVLVSAAMDWDVVEGRKEGDVRYKTAERIRKKRKSSGEGEPLSEEEVENQALSVEAMRARSGTKDYDGVGGDVVIGRNTWKEYVRGLHEGWLGHVDPPKEPEDAQTGSEALPSDSSPGQSSLGDAAVKAAATTVTNQTSELLDSSAEDQSQQPSSETTDETAPVEKKKEEEEKPKPRQPPPYIQPSDYPSATASSNLPETIGPSIGVRLPHILGFRNTPIRTYRFLTRRHLADSIGRDVASAIMASYRPYNTSSSSLDGSSPSDSAPEQDQVLKHEERDWWKTTFQPRKEHEESVWIEDMVLDERIASRMRRFQLSAEDEDRAKRLEDGREKVEKRVSEEEG